jgi:hypothetical protein
MAAKKSPKGKSTPRQKEEAIEEPVWTYRGYKLKTSEFVTAMVHLFRAEMSGVNDWIQLRTGRSFRRVQFYRLLSANPKSITASSSSIHCW